MLVDVVCLRHNGDKLPPDVIAATTPVRGDLTLENLRGTNGWGDEKTNLIVARLAAPAGVLPVRTTAHD